MTGNSTAQSPHDKWMRRALELARHAAELGEVPVGAVLVLGDEAIGEGFNQPIRAADPTAHAEIVAIREACRQQRNYRLPGSVLYVTLEPCTMCVGALMHARVDTLVFGAREPRAGSVVSQRQLEADAYFNHRLRVIEGPYAEECGALLQIFFKARRADREPGASSGRGDQAVGQGTQ